MSERYGRLTVLEKTLIDCGDRRRAGCLCRCDCGNQKTVRESDLKNGTIKSCGCWRRDVGSAQAATKPRLRHGDTAGKIAREYRAWQSMITRCTNPKCNSWDNYGGRGIAVCDRWRKSYDAFIADMGRKPTPSHSIDRINVNGNYEPGNVRWATRAEQRANTRGTRVHRRKRVAA